MVVKQSDALAEKLARKQMLQAALLNLVCIKYPNQLHGVVKQTLETFMMGNGKYHTTHEKLDDVVAMIHKLTGTKPRVTTEKDGREVLWET